MELQAKTSKRIEVPVSNLQNKDPLDLDQDANWDAALEHIWERCQKESRSSSTTSRSSSTSKRHQSASRSGDEINPKKGRLTPDREHSIKSIVKPPDSAALAKIASCGKGRGRVITEKLKEIAMGPAASSRYTRKDDVEKKTTPRKSGFPNREEMEARKRQEAQKDWVVNHQEESIGEQYFSIRQQASWFAQEVRDNLVRLANYANELSGK